MYKKKNIYRKKKREPKTYSYKVTIFYPEDLFYGEIRLKDNKVLYEEDFKNEVETRLPFFKNKKYSISIS